MAKTRTASPRTTSPRAVARKTAAARSAATEAASATEPAVETLVAQVGDRLKEAGIDPERVLTAARDQAGEVQDKVAAEVQAHPLRTLGLAAAAGLVVGYLSSR